MTTLVGGAVVVTTLLSAVTIVGILVATSTPVAPVAMPDTYTVNKNNMYLFDVLDNDYDIRNLDMSIHSVDQPPYGRVEIVDSFVQLRYFAPHGFAGQEAFNYTITNGKMTASATVTVDVLNIPPETVDITYVVGKSEDRAFEARLFDYVTDAGRRILDLDNDTLTISHVSSPTLGDVEISSDHRTVLYTPKSRGVDKMIYSVTDGYDVSSSALIFSIGNEAPVANHDEYLRLKKDIKHTLNVMDNDYDPNGDDIVIQSGTCSAHHR